MKETPLSVLLATNRQPNSYTAVLARSLSPHCHLTMGTDNFWLCLKRHDIVHFHWPEELFSWRHVTRQGLIDLRALLEGFYSDCKIVVTMHNLQPHYDDNPLFIDLYKLLFGFAHAVIHFGNASIKLYQDVYSEVPRFQPTPLVHRMIPHQSYQQVLKRIPQESARKTMGISEDRKLMVVFGSIRHEEEEALVLDAFRAAKVPKKSLLVSNWKFFYKARHRYNLFLKMFYKLREVKWRRSQYAVFHHGLVGEDEIPNYLQAADIVFIPRKKVLNSGILPLAFTFGKVVVGPDTGNVGEWLRITGNPVFDPRSIRSLGQAVESAYALAGEGLGTKNARIALSDWLPENIAKQHILFYEELVSRE